jgi:aryl-alcohol dehydrogenase-like predicted oxidoreductase
LEVQNYKKFCGVRVVSISPLLSDFRSARIQHSYDAVEKGRGKKKKKTNKQKQKLKLLKKKKEFEEKGEVPCPQLMQTWILLRPIGDSVRKSAPMCSSSHRK